MTLRTPSWNDNENLLRIYAGDATDPNTFVIWLEGQERVVKRMPGESPHTLWARVRKTIQDIRILMQFKKLNGNPFAFAHIYADTIPSEAEKHALLREWIVSALFREAAPTSGNDDETRVAALSTLADIFGMRRAANSGDFDYGSGTGTITSCPPRHNVTESLLLGERLPSAS
jgi:hypothetical protein